MKNQTALTTIIAALFLVVVGVNSGFAKSKGSTSGHHDIDTGKDFGDHVSDHAVGGQLGKDHNPGNHKGFSGIKD